MDAQADLKASVTFTPERSQIFIVFMLLLAGISLLGGFAFLWGSRDHSWVPFAFTAGFIGVATIAWFHSHKNVDMQGSSPTTISTKQGGAIEVTTDMRTFLTPEALIGLTKIVSLISCRQPLPEPDGLVANDGKPIPSMKDEALVRVLEVNKEAERLAQQVVGPDASLQQSKVIEQPKIGLSVNLASVNVSTNVAT